MTRWSIVVHSITRPYPVTLPMVLLVSLIPLYIFIPELLPGRTLYRPELALDRAIPLQPSWAMIYGALYFFLILLPIFVVREQEQIRRTVHAYLSVWITAYLFFIFYPTVAPRPLHELVPGDGYGAWSLRILYGIDPPYNCFPSLHVAHSFVSALTCYRLHRGLGVFATACAALVGLSTLFTKQHYVLDVVAGMLMAFAAYAVFLRTYPREKVPAADRLVAPLLAACLLGVAGLIVTGAWAVYLYNS